MRDSFCNRPCKSCPPGLEIETKDETVKGEFLMSPTSHSVLEEEVGAFILLPGSCLFVTKDKGAKDALIKPCGLSDCASMFRY